MKTFKLYIVFYSFLLTGFIAGLAGCADKIDTPSQNSGNFAGMIMYTTLDQANIASIPSISIVDTNGYVKSTIGGDGKSYIIGLGAAGGKILYTKSTMKINPTDTTEQTQVIVANNDNSSQHVLYTKIPGEDLQVLSIAISPDGSKVSYATVATGATTATLYAINSDGTGKTKITDLFNIQTTPGFSSDGKRIVYYTDDNIETSSGPCTLEVAATETGNIHKICDIDDASVDGAGIISWRPSTNVIAFYDAQRIFWADVSQFNSKNYIDSGGTPMWSPDGTTLAYALMKGDIVLTSDLGLTKTNMTNTPGRFEAYPQWSADGKKIACMSWQGDFDHTSQSINLINVATKDNAPLAGPGMFPFFLK